MEKWKTDENDIIDEIIDESYDSSSTRDAKSGKRLPMNLLKILMLEDPKSQISHQSMKDSRPDDDGENQKTR